MTAAAANKRVSTVIITVIIVSLYRLTVPPSPTDWPVFFFQFRGGTPPSPPLNKGPTLLDKVIIYAGNIETR